MGIAREVVWRCIGEEKSVLAFQECREKCFGVGEMARKMFVLVLREWDCGDGKNKCYGVAGVTIWPPLSAAITIDWWTGAWSDDFAPRRG